VNLNNRDEAFSAAQRYGRPAQLWDEGGRLCSITQSGGMWIISK
jgi:hypothetical protein